ARAIGGPAPSLVHHLLGQVAVVDHLDAAEALWRRNGVVATYVTPAGEVLSPAGRLRGGSGATADEGVGEHSLLARKRQLRELDEEGARLIADVDTRQAAAAALAAELTTLRARLGGRHNGHRAGARDPAGRGAERMPRGRGVRGRERGRPDPRAGAAGRDGGRRHRARGTGAATAGPARRATPVAERGTGAHGRERARRGARARPARGGGARRRPAPPNAARRADGDRG